MTWTWLTDIGDGPLVLLDRSQLAHWLGTTGRGDGVVDDPLDDAASDHARAAEVYEEFASIPVGTGRALVLGDEPSPTAFVALAQGGLLVRLIGGEDGPDLRAAVEALSDYPTPDSWWPTDGGGALLFDSKQTGNEATGIDVQLTAATYDIAVAVISTGDIAAIVLRLLPEAPG